MLVTLFCFINTVHMYHKHTWQQFIMPRMGMYVHCFNVKLNIAIIRAIFGMDVLL
jgi:hypothetical protein